MPFFYPNELERMLYEGGRNAELDWAMKKLEGKSFQKFICVLAWFAMIYHF